MDDPLSTLDCLESVVDAKDNGTNKHRYIIATQDPEVRAQMRTISGVPLVYINRSVMILEPMSTATDKARQAEERGKIRAGLHGRRGGATAEVKRKREEVDEEEGSGDVVDGDAPAPKRKRVKGPKGPNPLSVKKAGADGAKKQKSTASGLENGHATARRPKQDVVRVDNDQTDRADGGVIEGTDGQTNEPRKRKRKRKSLGIGGEDKLTQNKNQPNDLHESLRDMGNVSP